jgi:hypothetical protein
VRKRKARLARKQACTLEGVAENLNFARTNLRAVGDYMGASRLSATVRKNRSWQILGRGPGIRKWNHELARLSQKAPVWYDSGMNRAHAPLLGLALRGTADIARIQAACNSQQPPPGPYAEHALLVRKIYFDFINSWEKFCYETCSG